ncbi:hypothetical protein ACHAP5_009101 [Fusarium lateritium]
MAADGPFPIDDFDFAMPIIEMDPHLGDIQSTQFDLDLSLLPLPVPDLPEPSNEINPGYVSLSGSVYNQTSDSILDEYLFEALGSDGTQQHIDAVSQGSISIPADTSTDNSPGSETNKRQFTEDAVIRLKNNEFREHGKWLCNWPKCDKSFDENRKRK